MADQRNSQRRLEYESLYHRHSREVWALAYARWMDADSALDITQEAFLRLWKQLESGEVIQTPRAWLMRVARNLAEDYSKSAFRRNGTQSPEFLGGLVGRSDQPAELAEREETFARIREILETLPTMDREILTLRYAMDQDVQTIANTLGVATTAVHMRLSRARQRLAEKLIALGEVDNPGEH